jgi:hypothetical protein
MDHLADAGDYSIDSSMDYTFADSWALDINSDQAADLETLVAYLTARMGSDREKVRAIYRWIGANIDYDVNLLARIREGGGRNRSADETFTMRSAVCGGYANLFRRMAELAGLKAVYLSGPSLTFDGVVGHAWNAVMIDGKWRLLDATWAAGYVEDAKTENGKFIRKFTDIYFLTPAEHFIYTHFPEDPQWQLLEEKINKEQFMAYAKPSVHFFVQGFDIQGLSHQDRHVHAAEKVEFKLTGPPEAELAAALKRGEEIIKDRVFCRNLKNGDHTVTVWFPAPGTYDVIIFSKINSSPTSASSSAASSSTEDYRTILQYRVTASDGIAIDQVQSQAKIVPSPAFHQLGLDAAFLSHDTVRIWAQGRIMLEFRGPEGLSLLGQVMNMDSQGKAADEIQGASFAQGNGGTYAVHLGFPAEGDYLVNIFGKQADDPGNFQLLMQYCATSQTAPDWNSGAAFPKVYSIFAEKQCFLNSPMTGSLTPGEAMEFSVKTPGAEAVSVNVNGKWHKLEDQGDGDFSGDVIPRTGQVILYAKYPGMTDFSGLLSWECSN